MVTLSASKLKKLEFCSWSFNCDYIIKLPRTSNDGARRGTVTHLILEVLLNPRHRKHYDTVSKYGLKKDPACERLVRKTMKKEGVAGEENFDMINDFIITGLNFDYFIEGYDLLDPELAFDIKNDRYHIIGFIDKLGIKGSIAKIVDYKTSKQKPSGEEKKFNIQGLMYQLAIATLYPQVKKSFVDFLYLKFKKKPKEVFSVSNDTLKGFEEYLAHVTEVLQDFTFEKATSNFAKNDFLKKNLCGTRESRFKDDGSPKWRCPHLMPFDYFVIVDDGKDVKSAMTKEELKPKENQKIEKRRYKGCVAFYPENYREELKKK